MMCKWPKRLRGFIHVQPRSLRSQLLSRSLFILAALLLLIGGFQYVLMKDFLYQNQAEKMISQIRGPLKDLFNGQPPERFEMENPGMNITGNRNSEQKPMLFLPDSSLAFISKNQSFVDLTSGSGITAPQLDKGEYAAILSPDYNSRETNDYRVIKDEQGNEQLVVFRTVSRPAFLGQSGQSIGLLQMGTFTAPLRKVVLRQLLTFAALSLLALAGGLLLYLPVLRRTLGPLGQMIQTVEDIDAGNLDNRFPALSGQAEIDRLAVSFNGMLERLEASFHAERDAKEQMRRFVADASHELRTPLTSIHGFLEVLLRGAADRPEQLHAALNSMLGESKRMKKLVEDLLTLAKLDRAPVIQQTKTRLDTLISEMEPHLTILAGERKVYFELTPDVVILCDCDQIKQVVLNLFHNAVQHTDPADGRITVTLNAGTGLVYVRFRDNGPGIAKEHLPHVFERFYRSDASRTRKQGGAGLGLAISKAIAEAHGGYISAYSEPGNGATFEVVLPALPGL